MADITMCSGEGCPLKGNCYRFNAVPSKFYQSYFTNPPFEHEQSGEVTCTHQWKNNEIKGI